MGNGASAGISAATKSASDAELREALSTLSADEKAKLKAMLTAPTMDKNADGKVSMIEAKKGLITKYPALEKAIKVAFLDADADGDFYLKGAEVKVMEAALAAYAKVDASGDGKVSLMEAKKALEAEYPKLGAQVKTAFLEEDDSGDFYLDFREWAAVHATLADFAAVDSSNDGKVSVPEAKKALGALYPELSKELTGFFLTADADGSFYLSLSELMGLRRSMAAFAQVDLNNDGKISMPEAKKAFKREFPSRVKAVNAFFMVSDESKDFYLSGKEFGALMRVVASFNKSDRSGDGKVSLPEAKKGLARDFASELKAKPLTALFMEFDGKGGDFYLSPKEYYGLYKKLAE